MSTIITVATMKVLAAARVAALQAAWRCIGSLLDAVPR